MFRDYHSLETTRVTQKGRDCRDESTWSILRLWRFQGWFRSPVFLIVLNGICTVVSKILSFVGTPVPRSIYLDRNIQKFICKPCYNEYSELTIYLVSLATCSCSTFINPIHSILPPPHFSYPLLPIPYFLFFSFYSILFLPIAIFNDMSLL